MSEPASLKDRVLAGLRKLPRSISYKQVADDTGVGHSWICMLVSGKIEEPGVTKLEKLNAYLVKQSSTAS